MKSTIKIPRGQLANVFKEYATITALLADQANQSSNRLYKVIDASLDPNLTFLVGETKKHAYYEYKEVATGSIDDYTLVSVPYGNHIGGGGVQSVTGDGVDNTDPDNPVLTFPKEEDIRGTAVEKSGGGVDTIDLSILSHYNYEMLSNLIITLTGLPPVGKSFTRTGVVVSSTGVETLTFANSTNEFGSYDPSKVNFITIMVSNTTVAGVIINVFYAQPN